MVTEGGIQASAFRTVLQAGGKGKVRAASSVDTKEVEVGPDGSAPSAYSLQWFGWAYKTVSRWSPFRINSFWSPSWLTAVAPFSYNFSSIRLSNLKSVSAFRLQPDEAQQQAR